MHRYVAGLEKSTDFLVVSGYTTFESWLSAAKSWLCAAKLKISVLNYGCYYNYYLKKPSLIDYYLVSSSQPIIIHIDQIIVDRFLNAWISDGLCSI